MAQPLTPEQQRVADLVTVARWAKDDAKVAALLRLMGLPAADVERIIAKERVLPT